MTDPRLDQALANVLLLVGIDTPTVLMDERNECVLVRPGAPFTFATKPDEIVSLLPVTGDVHGAAIPANTNGRPSGRWKRIGRRSFFGPVHS